MPFARADGCAPRAPGDGRDMTQQSIHVADLGGADSPGAALADSIAATLAERFEPDHTVRRGSAGDVDDDSVGSIDAVVLIVDDATVATPVHQFAASLEEEGVVLVVVPTTEIRGEIEPGLAGLPIADADPALVAAMLAGILSRVPEITRLNQELAVARRYHGGLSEEITRFHDELQYAAMMQRELLPAKMPTAGDVAIDAIWRPAAYVSGDIYACHVLDDERIAIFLADCVGHGVPAALMTMSVMRSFAIHGLAGREPRPPHEVLARINRDMTSRKGGTTRFATGVYGILDPHDRSLEIAVAGHPPALLFDRDGNELEVDGDGPLLGVFGDAEFSSRRVDVPEQATILLYSDGFEQAIPEAGQRGASEAYRRLFRELAPLGHPRAMREHVEAALDGSSGSLHQADDVTLLCVRTDTPAISQPLDAADEDPGEHRLPRAA